MIYQTMEIIVRQRGLKVLKKKKEKKVVQMIKFFSSKKVVDKVMLDWKNLPEIINNTDSS